MAGGAGRAALIGAAAAALAVGFAGGWLGGRSSVPEPPPPPVYRNPLADAVKGETLAHIRPGDNTRTTYRVLQADDSTVLLAVETAPLGQAMFTREVRVARSFFGPLLVLEGDLPAAEAASSFREFVLETAEQETIRVDALGRSLRCLKFSGRHRSHGRMTFWVSDEVPVHGVVRVTSEKGVQGELVGVGAPR